MPGFGKKKANPFAKKNGNGNGNGKKKANPFAKKNGNGGGDKPTWKPTPAEVSQVKSCVQQGYKKNPKASIPGLVKTCAMMVKNKKKK